MATPQATYADRIKTVQRWLRASGWTVDGDHDTAAIADRAAREWYPANRQRARILVAKAARLLRGEAVNIAGGAPRKSATFAALIGAELVYERQALDMTTDERALVTALSGDGQALELQLIRPDGMTEIITIRHRDDID
jgi:hypothetical protein